MCLQVFLKVDEDCAEVTLSELQKASIPDSRCSHAEDSIADCFQSGTPDDKFVTRRRLESLNYVNHRRLPTASFSPGILMPCYCSSRTQERPDNAIRSGVQRVSGGYTIDIHDSGDLLVEIKMKFWRMDGRRQRLAQAPMYVKAIN